MNFSGAPADVAAIAAMTECLAPRGPDASGLQVHGPVGFGHRRLKIIDLSDHSRQPLVDSMSGATIVFNGCIYNYRELRDELISAGATFFSQGDTEVVLRAWQQWGEQALDRLQGMFAFVIHERDSGRVIMARDRFGIKPLYLSQQGQRLRFASSLPALLAGGDVDTGIDKVALNHYAGFRVVPRHARSARVRDCHRRRCCFERRTAVFARQALLAAGIRRRPTSSNWAPTNAQPGRRRPELAIAALVADVPVGVLLSGEVDSGLIVALLANAGQHGLELSRSASNDQRREGRRFRVLEMSWPGIRHRPSSDLHHDRAGCWSGCPGRLPRCPNRWCPMTMSGSTCSRRRSPSM
ncbi:MAG: asparagine synthase-related protein [Burkholderiaceae bacterium]